VFQLHNLLPALTALENVEVPMTGQLVRARGGRGREQPVVGLGTRMQHLRQLSGGQRSAWPWRARWLDHRWCWPASDRQPGQRGCQGCGSAARNQPLGARRSWS
jgi:hypothetical protein